jgi:hypothetical protein
VKDGSSVEPLGFAPLKDDAEALAFGRQVILELMDENAAQYSGWILDITEGTRAVGSIPFDSGRNQERK